jgi:hypothetical protein
MAFPGNGCCFVFNIFPCYKNGDWKAGICYSVLENLLFIYASDNCGDALWQIWTKFRLALVDLLPGANADECVIAAAYFKAEQE